MHHIWQPEHRNCPEGGPGQPTGFPAGWGLLPPSQCLPCSHRSYQSLLQLERGGRARAASCVIEKETGLLLSFSTEACLEVILARIALLNTTHHFESLLVAWRLTPFCFHTPHACLERLEGNSYVVVTKKRKPLQGCCPVYFFLHHLLSDTLWDDFSFVFVS